MTKELSIMVRHEQLKQLKAESADLSTADFLLWAIERFPDASFATSLGAEDQALLWLLEQSGKSLEVFTLDTGRLPEQTYELLQANRSFFRLPIKVMFPDTQALQSLVDQHGPNLFYDSLALRKACCGVRKVEPLKRALSGRSAWLTGQRREQSPTRSALERVEYDEANGLIKLNPLADWTSSQVWELIHSAKIPYNSLHDQGYPSLGCAPCTRAVKPGEDERAGRWWWEASEHKECGLHVAVPAGRQTIQVLGRI